MSGYGNDASVDPTTKAWDETFDNANKINLGAPRGKSKSGKMVDSYY